ncbi:MAG: PIG-L family deacetylase [Steroidobacter sp.]
MMRMASRIFWVLLAGTLLTQCRSPALNELTPRRAPVLLAIFAHPDDEASVGPVLAKYAAAGVQVHLAVATDGRLGVTAHAGIPAGDALAAARNQELACATDRLGLQAPIQFGLYDQFKMTEGLEPYMTQLNELRERVRKLFEELQPDAVITWGPSGWTGHPDHRLVSAIVTEVFQSERWVRPTQLYYPGVPTGPNPIPVATVDERFVNVRIDLEPRDYEKAKASWLCHRSQYTPEQIEQMHQSLVSLQQGVAYFQPLVPNGQADSLLPRSTN